MPLLNFELHVWGKDTDISLIDPESRACSWLLFLHLTHFNTPFSVITSCNTNLADTRKLPLLIVHDGTSIEKHEGYYAIVEYVSKLHPAESKFIPNNRMSSKERLVNLTLTNYIHNTFHYLNQYNLYVVREIYELYTRKLFSSLLPFPMYYNQPLKFYHNACEQVRIVGLSASSAGFLGLSGPVSETEISGDEEEEKNSSNAVAISTLQEKVMLAKDQNKALLRESRMRIRCLNLLDEYINHVMALFRELNPESPVDFAHLFRPTKISASELLLYAYIYSMTHPDLPDRFMWRYLIKKFPSFSLFSTTITEALNGAMSASNFEEASGEDVPNFWNEFKFLANSFKKR